MTLPQALEETSKRNYGPLTNEMKNMGALAGAPKKLVYEIIDRRDPRTELTAMMRTTAFPVAIIAWMACAGKIDKRGVIPQEIAVDPQFFIGQLKKRDIKLYIHDQV